MVVLLSLAACTDDTEYTAGVWYRRSDFDGVARTDAAGFTIGNVGYLCTGYRGSTKDRLKDCWAYRFCSRYQRIYCYRLRCDKKGLSE